MLFDVFDVLIEFQGAVCTNNGAPNRATIRRLRESLIAGRTLTEANSVTSEVSRDLALSFLLTCDETSASSRNLAAQLSARRQHDAHCHCP
jgi:hypothetical protein